MKYFLILLSFLLIEHIFSQKVEFGVQSAYSFSIPNSIIGKKQMDVYNSGLSISNIRGSLSSGVNLGLTTNLKIHEHVKLCLAYELLYGNKVVFQNFEKNDTTLKLMGQAKQQRFIPGFMFYFSTKKINFYTKTSLVLPMKTESDFMETQTKSKDELSIYSKNQHYLYNYSFGFHNAIGAEVNVNKSFKISLSLESILLNLTVKSSKINSFTQQNVDQLNNLTTYEKETTYRENLSNFSNNSTYNSLFDSSKSKDDLSFNHHFSSILFKLSFIYVFHEKK